MKRAVLAVTVVVHASTALAEDADSKMHRQLVGVWYIEADAAQAQQTGSYSVQQLNADGSGGMYIHRKNYCGPVIQLVPFQWDLKAAVLTEHYQQNGKVAMARGKVMSIDATHYVQGNAKGGTAPYGHYMTLSRAPACAVS
jgi:hypothetical protein